MFFSIIVVLAQSATAGDEPNIESCPAELEPTFLAKVESPGLPAGGGKPPTGWAIVEFVISEDGSTTNAKVVEASNRIFERGAVRTVLKSKYAPRSAPCLHQLRVDFEIE